jgi:hypothetical protein
VGHVQGAAANRWCLPWWKWSYACAGAALGSTEASCAFGRRCVEARVQEHGQATERGKQRVGGSGRGQAPWRPGKPAGRPAGGPRKRSSTSSKATNAVPVSVRQQPSLILVPTFSASAASSALCSSPRSSSLKCIRLVCPHGSTARYSGHMPSRRRETCSSQATRRRNQSESVGWGQEGDARGWVLHSSPKAAQTRAPNGGVQWQQVGEPAAACEAGLVTRRGGSWEGFG